MRTGPRGASLGRVVAVLCPFTALVLYMSQWEPITIAAVFVGFEAARRKRPWVLGAALVVMASKPTNVWLLGLIYLAIAARWPWREIVRMLTIPAVVGFASFVLAGFDWPLRYWHMLGVYPPTSVNVGLLNYEVFGVSLAPLAVVGIAWALWEVRRGVTHRTVIIALVANLLVSPYVVPYHYAQISPAVGYLAAQSRGAAVVTSLVCAGGFAIFWNDAGHVAMNLYPLLIVVLLLVLSKRSNEDPVPCESEATGLASSRI